MDCIKKYKINYTQVTNKVLYDERLSLGAKGLYAYLFSKPDYWEFHIEVMQKELKETKGKIRTYIKELIDFGYINRQQKNENGKFGGIIYEFLPCEEIPCAENAHTVNAYAENLNTNNTNILSNTDNIININLNKKNIYKKDFEEFWEIYPKQRAGSKEKAYKSYCKAIDEERITHQELMKAVWRYKDSKEVSKGFAKGCAAWLNDDRFNCIYEVENEWLHQDFSDL